MELKELVAETSMKMDEVIEHFQNELKSINTGKASSLLVEGIVVNYFGTPTPLKQVATIATPDANQIAITPWDRNILSEIEMAIRNSDLGLSPTNDGKSVRISLPPMTEQRRSELTKVINKMSEETKVALRNIRGSAWESVQEAEKRSDLTEDDRDQAKKDLNETISKKNLEVEVISKNKQAEIMKI